MPASPAPAPAAAPTTPEIAELERQIAAADGGQSIMGRQGYEILQQAQALKQAEQEIDATEVALQTMQQDALQVGAPRSWLQ
jgi:hypothetical protein